MHLGGLLLLGVLFATTKLPGAPRSNQTDLLAGHRVTSNRRGVTNVLMVTTAVWVLDWVHSHTANLGPAIALGLVLVERPPSLEQRLVDAAAAGDDSNSSSRKRRDALFLAGRQADASPPRTLDVLDNLCKAA